MIASPIQYVVVRPDDPVFEIHAWTTSGAQLVVRNVDIGRHTLSLACVTDGVRSEQEIEWEGPAFAWPLPQVPDEIVARIDGAVYRLTRKES